MKNKKCYIYILLLLLIVPFCSVGAITKCDCGSITNIPKKIPELTNLIITVIEIATPVILILMGSFDLFKGIYSSKDDEIKKAQQLFVKRLITAALIFFIIVITKFLISVIDKNSSSDIIECMDCFVTDVSYCKCK